MRGNAATPGGVRVGGHPGRPARFARPGVPTHPGARPTSASARRSNSRLTRAGRNRRFALQLLGDFPLWRGIGPRFSILCRQSTAQGTLCQLTCDRLGRWRRLPQVDGIWQCGSLFAVARSYMVFQNCQSTVGFRQLHLPAGRADRSAFKTHLVCTSASPAGRSGLRRLWGTCGHPRRSSRMAADGSPFVRAVSHGERVATGHRQLGLACIVPGDLHGDVRRP